MSLKLMKICRVERLVRWELCCFLLQVIAATNRVDILDPALLRSGRLDRKIEFPHPNEEARARIMQIHSRKMNVSPDVNFEELSRSTDDFNGAQCKAVCVEAVGLCSIFFFWQSVEWKSFLIFTSTLINLFCHL